MPRVLHEIEKKIICALREVDRADAEKLGSVTGLSPDQVRRGTEWLRLKGLATVRESRQSFISLGKNGLEALSRGLPERRLLGMLQGGPRPIAELQRELGQAFGPAMGIAKRNGWISNRGGDVLLKSPVRDVPGEGIIRQVGSGRIPRSEIRDQETLEALGRRPDFIVEEVTKSRTVRLLDEALHADVGDPDPGVVPTPGGRSSVRKHVGRTLGSRYDVADPGPIDVEADVPEAHPARIHPLTDTIGEIREAFVTLGFSEIVGDLSQSSFWNFDALFTPQDHPAREMQDTFYLDGISSGRPATAEQIRRVSLSHKRSWGYDWSVREARRMVLRTHTTCVTIRHLAEHRPDEARVFSLGRVFRNEKVSYKHLVEFNQVEGVVVGRDATLRELMGIQREFYRRIGLGRVKFWPTFFPYTEPSLQSMVYNERLGRWVELFGMGIFRPEVTRPLGIRRPVLAWGGGIERIAMMKYGVDDVRRFYGNGLKWLRGAARCL